MRARWSMGSLLVAAMAAVSVYSAEPEPLPPARVAPIYALPSDGVWVDYDFQYLDIRNKEHKGKMRISSVGYKRSKEGLLCRWIEIKMQGSTFETRWGKFLVAETVFGQGKSLEDSVKEAYHQEGVEGRIMNMSGTQISDYFTMGIRGDLRVVKQEPIETKLGKFDARKVVASGKGRQRPNRSDEADSVQRELEYRAWLTNDKLFGVVRFEVWGRVGDDPARIVFQAEATKAGSGAKSEMNESRKK